MKSRLNQVVTFLTEKIIAKIIVGVIVGAILLFITHQIPVAWLALVGFLSDLGSVMKAPIPFWICVIAVVSCPTLIWFVQKLRSVTSSISPQKSYTSDTIHEMPCFWDYDDAGRIDTYNIYFRCPRCHSRLEAYKPGNYNWIPAVEFECQNCDFRKNFKTDYADFLETVALEIERRFYTGEYLRRNDDKQA